MRLLQDFLSRPGDFEASGCQPSDAAVFAERAFSVYKQEFLVGISANDTALLGDVWLAAWRESQRVADPLRGLETAIDLLTKTERRHFDSVSRVLRGLPDHVQQRFWLGPKASCGGHAPLVALTAGEYKAVRRAAEAYAKR